MRSCAGTGGRGEGRREESALLAARQHRPARNFPRRCRPPPGRETFPKQCAAGGQDGPGPPAPPRGRCRRSRAGAAAGVGREQPPRPRTPRHGALPGVSDGLQREGTGPRSPSPGTGGSPPSSPAARRVKPREGGGGHRARRVTAAGLGGFEQQQPVRYRPGGKPGGSRSGGRPPRPWLLRPGRSEGAGALPRHEDAEGKTRSCPVSFFLPLSLPFPLISSPPCASRPPARRDLRGLSDCARITSKNLIRTLPGRQPVRGKIYGFEVCRYPIIKE